MLADDIRAALGAEGPILDPALALMLADVGWRRLAIAGIDRESYATRRAVDGDPSSRAEFLLELNRWNGSRIGIETFSDRMPPAYAEIGIREANLPAPRIREALEAGLDALADHAAAKSTVVALVKSIHILAVDDPAFDVSYSDPEVPFSIFIGVHAVPVENEALRIAEAILHEAMHLQLSLAEDVVPMVSGGAERWTSPWQRRPRPVQGVLHGMYVFAAIAEFLRHHRTAHPSNPDHVHVETRLRIIAEEIGLAADAVGSAEFTLAGRTLARRLAGDRGPAS